MGDALDLDALVGEIRRRHEAHTVVLYGSRARGDASPSSDVDLIAIRESGGADRDVTPWRGFALDIHVYDDATLPEGIAKHAKGLEHARVLADAAGAGQRVLARARFLLAQPRPAPEGGHLRAYWGWADKMRARIRAPDPTLRAIQRAVLVAEILPAWAELRARWYGGTKESIETLRVADPAAHAALLSATRPGAEAEDLERLIDAVFHPSLRPPDPEWHSAPPRER